MFETVLQPVLEAMLVAWKPSLAISSYFLLLFVAGELLYRVMQLPTEHTRKLSHMGAGVAIMSFPWLFDHWAPVVLLSLAFPILATCGFPFLLLLLRGSNSCFLFRRF